MSSEVNGVLCGGDLWRWWQHGNIREAMPVFPFLFFSARTVNSAREGGSVHIWHTKDKENHRIRGWGFGLMR